jgi:uncharacterized iron-regulated membrane protein
MQARWRRRWLTVHRWIGLTVGLLFVLLGLTGSLLVFDHAIDEWLNPSLLLTKGSGERLPISEVTREAETAYLAAHPGRPATAAAVSSPRTDDGVWTAWFMSGTETTPAWTMVYVDPYSGDVTGQRVWGTDLMGTVYRLHYTLLGGEFGAIIVGVAGIVLMISIASGVWLWWPLWKNGWRAAFAVRRGRRFNYDLHKTLGIGGAPILLVVAFTGVYMNLPSLINPLIDLVSKRTEHAEGITSNAAAATAPIAAERAIAIARDAFPDATFDHFHPPQAKDGTYEIGLRQPGEPQTSFGATQVIIDQYTGRVLAVRDSRQLTAGDDFVAWQFPLHNGEAFGLAGRLVVFASGIAPAVLYVTGVMLWWRRRRPRRLRQPRETLMVDPVRNATSVVTA